MERRERSTGGARRKLTPRRSPTPPVMPGSRYRDPCRAEPAVAGEEVHVGREGLAPGRAAACRRGRVGAAPVAYTQCTGTSPRQIAGAAAAAVRAGDTGRVGRGRRREAIVSELSRIVRRDRPRALLRGPGRAPANPPGPVQPMRRERTGVHDHPAKQGHPETHGVLSRQPKMPSGARSDSLRHDRRGRRAAALRQRKAARDFPGRWSQCCAESDSDQMYFAISTAVSSIRLEKPHSLSYQVRIRTKLPSITLVWSRWKIDECGSWLKSIETFGTSV